MAETSKKPRPARRGRSSVAISNTATNMISSLVGRGGAKFSTAVANITSDIQDPDKVERVSGYDKTFVARGHGMQIVFTQDGDNFVVDSVSAD